MISTKKLVYKTVEKIGTIINDGKVNIDTTAASGTVDGDLNAAITALSWASSVISSSVLNFKKLFTKILDGYPRFETKDSWFVFKANGYMICCQQFYITPDAANTTKTRTVSLPYTMYSSSSYYVLVTSNNVVETGTYNIAGYRNTASTVDISLYCGTTTQRSVYCTVIGRLA